MVLLVVASVDIVIYIIIFAVVCICLYAVGAEDIVSDNYKLVLGLVWSYINRYQLGKTKVSPLSNY